ncbi:MAG: 30S ribosomal protein S6 [Patescibacteria group bacterium]
MKSYEITYLLNPGLSQEDAVLCVGKITQAIEKSGGNIIHIEEPKKRKFAYFVKKHGYGYFGYSSFNLEEASMNTLKRCADEEKDIIRFMIVSALKINKNVRERPLPRHLMGRNERALQQQKKYTQRKKEEPKQPVDIEAIDKKLDEILK